jgi:hypothetical protein
MNALDNPGVVAGPAGPGPDQGDDDPDRKGCGVAGNLLAIARVITPETCPVPETDDAA